jgi:hypothetical protein
MAGMERYIPRMPRDDEPIPAELNLRCTTCGFCLTGLLERRCPECGEAFEPRETWLENERSTWEYHFANVRSKADYARIAYLAVAILCFLALVCADFKTIFAFPVVVLGEMSILRLGEPALRVRMAYWTVCVGWGVLMAVFQ